MTQAMQERTDTVPDPVGAVLGQLVGDFAATAGVVLTALGRRVGLWDALAAGPAPAEAVAERAGAALPYVREWLRSQAAAGYVSYDPAAETFGLAPGVAGVLGEGPLSGLADGMAAQFAVWWAQLDRYEAAFHGVVARLSAGAAVADVGCGYGAACIAMAEAFPESRFTGFDIDDASVARARRAALAAGAAERVSFEVAAAADICGGPYGLVMFIDSLHDLGDPAGALRRAGQVLADDGVVLLAEHAGSGKLEENLHPVGRFFYAASALVCVPNALSGEHAEAPLGSIPGEQSLRRVASAAGFSRVRRVEAGAPLNLLLELRL